MDTDPIKDSIARIKPLADAVVEAATALNAAIKAAADQGLSVKVDVLDQRSEVDEEPIPLVRARISKRIA